MAGLISVVPLSLTACGGGDGEATVTDWEVPDKYRTERTENAGEVVKFEYTAHDYALGTSATEVKSCNVYLPYGYDGSKQYNII